MKIRINGLQSNDVSKFPHSIVLFFNSFSFALFVDWTDAVKNLHTIPKKASQLLFA